MSEGSGSPRSSGAASLTSNMMTTKQYFLVNLSKFVVEIVGTGVLGIFYLTVGNQQAGMLLGMWIINLFGVAISGAHFNPGVTLCAMLRKNSAFGSRRLLGLIYIVAQFLGGLAAASISKFLMNNQEGSNLAVSPVQLYNSDDLVFEYRNFPALVSELTGSAFFIFLIMICTDKKTQFSEDKVINCFIMASSYVSARLMCGGTLVTTLYSTSEMEKDNKIVSRLVDADGVAVLPHNVGPLLNPALAFGQMVWSGDFSFIIQYFFMPFAGAAIALVFYEFVFVKSQEYLADGDESDASNKDLSLQDGIDQSPVTGKKNLVLEKDLDEEEEETR